MYACRVRYSAACSRTPVSSVLTMGVASTEPGFVHRKGRMATMTVQSLFEVALGRLNSLCSAHHVRLGPGGRCAVAIGAVPSGERRRQVNPRTAQCWGRASVSRPLAKAPSRRTKPSTCAVLRFTLPNTPSVPRRAMIIVSGMREASRLREAPAAQSFKTDRRHLPERHRLVRRETATGPAMRA